MCDALHSIPSSPSSTEIPDDDESCTAFGIAATVSYESRDPDPGLQKKLVLNNLSAGAGFVLAETPSRLLPSVNTWGGGLVRLGARPYPTVDGAQPLVNIFQEGTLFGGWDWEGHQLFASAGILSNSWLDHSRATLEDLQGPWALTQGLLDSSDIGIAINYSGFDENLSGSCAVVTGEGLNREMNEGQNIECFVKAKPFGFFDDKDPEWLTLAAYFQNGSKGLGYAADNRLGLSGTSIVDLHYHQSQIKGVLKFMTAEGVDGDSAVTPNTLTAQIEGTAPVIPVSLSIRYDQITWAPEEEDSRQMRNTWGLSIPVGPIKLIVERSHDIYGSQALEIAGAGVDEETIWTIGASGSLGIQK